MIQPHNRHMSFSIYISALAVSDTFTLVNGMYMLFMIDRNQCYESVSGNKTVASKSMWVRCVDNMLTAERWAVVSLGFFT